MEYTEEDIKLASCGDFTKMNHEQVNLCLEVMIDKKAKNKPKLLQFLFNNYDRYRVMKIFNKITK